MTDWIENTAAGIPREGDYVEGGTGGDQHIYQNGTVAAPLTPTLLPSASSLGNATDSMGNAAAAASSPSAVGSSAESETSTSTSGVSVNEVHSDTLNSIAKSVNVPLSKIEELNPPISDPNPMTPGEKVDIANAVPAQPLVSASSTNTAQVTGSVEPAAIFGSGSTSDNSFPTSSSYHTPASAAPGTQEGLGNEAGGWAADVGEDAADVLKTVAKNTESAAQTVVAKILP